MTAAFIRKRIREQEHYIAEVSVSNRTWERKLELVNSAGHILLYFQTKLEAHECD